VKDDLAKLIGIGMFQNKDLVSLSLAHNKLTDQFIRPFMAGLEKCQTMRELDLSHNKLGDVTAKLFVHLLRLSANKIESLDLSNNMLTKKFIGDLQLVIDDCPRIRYLNTDMNQGISHAQRLAVKHSLARNVKHAEDMFIPRTIMKRAFLKH
jgi:Ran GTPase-activating protein (RanGAP) involved in mRNA processing and transport